LANARRIVYRTYSDNSNRREDEPSIIPLQFLGQQDVDLTNLSASELLTWALANVWTTGGEGPYGVKHGSQAVNTFGYDPERGRHSGTNYWEQAFPTLFPFGRGGFESEHTLIGLQEHVRWALRYHDRRFRVHNNFPFVSFSIIQRREALISARIQMRRNDFKREADLLQSVTREKMQLAADQEAKGQPISDPAIKALRKHMHAVAGRVKATDASRIRLRSMMWSMSYALNPPNVWITINPDDIDNPIVQLLTGADIDLDNFLSTDEPSKTERGARVAADPFAAAEYFNLIMNAIVTHFLGITTARGRVKTAKGIFGNVRGYFGVVESQGRGTLHMHMLLWLNDSPDGKIYA
jgi:hypothetical protein